MINDMSVTYDLNTIPSLIDLISNSENDSLNNEKNTDSLKIVKIQCKSAHNINYNLITYNKSVLCYDLINSIGLCRSIILNASNELVCFAPPKSLKFDQFKNKHPIINSNIIVQEFVEGTMINAFWDKSIGLNGAWEIATRQTIGANSGFYKYKDSKTFRQMFLEAAAENHFHLDLLNKNFCYSFVLQHPENRIVVPFSKKKLYIVGMYSILPERKVISYNINRMKDLDWYGSTISFPNTYSGSITDTYEDYQKKYASHNTSYDIMGVVFYNIVTGERTKLRNPVYENVRSMKGNQPKIQFQYYILRKTGRVGEFLKYYPEQKAYFSTLRDDIHKFTHTLFNNYYECFIKKNKLVNEYDQYKLHMCNLHKIYIDSLTNGKKTIITFDIVKNYVNNMEIPLLMYSINYPFRKRYLDFQKDKQKPLSCDL